MLLTTQQFSYILRHQIITTLRELMCILNGGITLPFLWPFSSNLDHCRPPAAMTAESYCYISNAPPKLSALRQSNKKKTSRKKKVRRRIQERKNAKRMYSEHKKIRKNRKQKREWGKNTRDEEWLLVN